MARHIHEQTEIGLVCLLKEGKPAGSKVTFILYHDDVEAKRIQGEVVTDANARAGKAATAKHTPDAVKPDKPKYVLTYKAEADGEIYTTDDEIHVWPKKGKLACKNLDGTKAFPGFKFKVMQNGIQSGPGYKAAPTTGEAEFKLEKGSGFSIVAVEPYEIVGDVEKNGTALRDLKSKGKLNFEAEFVSPKRPNDGLLKQWVNLDAIPVNKGADGLGHEIEISVGVKGDRHPDTGAASPEIIGAAGIFVFIKVKFSGPGGKKSKRNDPKTDLLTGLNLSDRVAVKEGATDAEWEYKGKVELKEAGGVGKFKLCLGKAGGDACEIKIGSTDACANATLTITNWRKMWYELMAPDFMELEARDLPNGTRVRDFAAAGLRNIKASGDNTFIEYEIYKSHQFTEQQTLAACPGSVFKREFFERTAGPAKVYLLTDYTFTKYPKNFDKGKGTRCTLVKGCDANLYNDGPGGDDDITRLYTTESAQADYDIWSSDRGIYWSPSSAFQTGGGADSVKDISWFAAFPDPDAYLGDPDYTFEADVNTADVDKADERTFAIAETLQNPAPCTIKFSKPAIGHVATSLDSAAKGVIDTWLAAIWTDAKVRPHGFKLRFKISGFKGNDRRDKRFLAIREYIANQVANTAPQIYKHPGLLADGTPRSGKLPWGTAINMDRSHHHKFAIDLPTANPQDPGNFVGALSATKCPIDVEITFEPQHGGNGLAGQGLQKGEILVKWGIACPMCITDTLLHELGHQYNMATVARGNALHKSTTADATHATGLTTPKTIKENEPVVAYRKNGSKGHCYTQMGHSGAHCAYGIGDTAKASPDINGGMQGLAGECTMYGEGGRNDAQRTRLAFCPQCTDYIRARDLSALK